MDKKFKKEEMVPGKRYRGYAYLNEYKQFCFDPEMTGSQAGRETIILSKEDVTISKTKNYLMVKVKTPLSLSEYERTRDLMKKFNVVYETLKDYEI